MSDEVLESNTLPVFYYNDYLVSEVGGGVGLNLFEPRYKHMCRLMMDRDPRFLFVPNFNHYQCIVCDVGFVVRVSSIDDSGRTFSIRGRAEERVVIDFMWVEPGTHGLHFAHYLKIPSHVVGLPRGHFQMFFRQLQASGWMLTPDNRLTHADAGRSELLFNTNFQNSTFLIMQTNSPEKASSLLQKALEPVAQCKPADLHRFVHIIQACPESSFLSLVLESVQSAFFFERMPYMHPRCIYEMLSSLRLSGIRDCREDRDVIISCDLPTAKLKLVRNQPGLVSACLPYLEQDPNDRADTCIHVSNDSNISFCAALKDCLVTVESVTHVLETLRWELNWPRICVLVRAREQGMGPLATLQDDPVQLVCDFIALKPRLKSET